jgi:NADH dehydrogenase
VNPGSSGTAPGIVKISLWAISHPTFGLPKRTRRLAAAPDASAEKAVA